MRVIIVVQLFVLTLTLPVFGNSLRAPDESPCGSKLVSRLYLKLATHPSDTVDLNKVVAVIAVEPSGHKILNPTAFKIKLPYSTTRITLDDAEKFWGSGEHISKIGNVKRTYKLYWKQKQINIHTSFADGELRAYEIDDWI